MSTLLDRPNVSLAEQPDGLVVSGDLSMNAAADVAAAGVSWLRTTRATSVQFDFSGVDGVSSAALSVMFEWLRASQVRQLPVSAIVLSPPLQRLATLAELEPLMAQHSPVQ